MSTTSQALKALLDGGPSGAKTYALMDCALDSTIYPTVQASQCPFVSLYGESWQSGLQDIAPYLLELKPGVPFSSELLTWDWYGNWGYFVQSAANLDDLAASLAPLTTATLPDGMDAFFRLQDPRVIRLFLGSATATNLQVLFAKAVRLIVPAQEVLGGRGEAAIVYALDGGKLKSTTTQLSA